MEETRRRRRERREAEPPLGNWILFGNGERVRLSLGEWKLESMVRWFLGNVGGLVAVTPPKMMAEDIDGVRCGS